MAYNTLHVAVELCLAGRVFLLSPPCDEDYILQSGYCPLMVPLQFRNPSTLVFTVKHLLLVGKFYCPFSLSSCITESYNFVVAELPDYFNLVFPRHLQYDLSTPCHSFPAVGGEGPCSIWWWTLSPVALPGARSYSGEMFSNVIQVCRQRCNFIRLSAVLR